MTFAAPKNNRFTAASTLISEEVRKRRTSNVYKTRLRTNNTIAIRVDTLISRQTLQINRKSTADAKESA